MKSNWDEDVSAVGSSAAVFLEAEGRLAGEVCAGERGAPVLLNVFKVDDRIACAAPVCMVAAEFQGGCLCENAPLLRIDLNNVEIDAYAAPRPRDAESLSRFREIMVPGLEHTFSTRWPGSADPEREAFVDQPRADAFLTREYRKPFVVPGELEI